MREFALIDGNGEEYPLTVEDSFLHDPSGLGFEHDNTYRQVGTRFIKANTSSNQSVISGKVHFHPSDAYEEYQKFVEFSGRDGLKLKYNLVGVPARSLNRKIKTINWNDLYNPYSTSRFKAKQGDFNTITGKFRYTEILIECDGSETITDYGNGVYSIPTVPAHARKINSITFCNGLPALNVDASDYDYSYGCGTLKGGTSSEIVFAVTPDSLQGTTISEWLANNKPQFLYTLENSKVTDHPYYIFNPTIMYNPEIDTTIKIGSDTSSGASLVTYEDKNGNIVSKSGDKIVLEDTVYGQQLNSLNTSSNIINKNRNTRFKKCGNLITDLFDVDQSMSNVGRYNHYYIDQYNDINYFNNFIYGETYKINGRFVCPHISTNRDNNNLPHDARDLVVGAVGFEAGFGDGSTGTYAYTGDYSRVRLRLTFVAQDAPANEITDNCVVLFTIEDKVVHFGGDSRIMPPSSSRYYSGDSMDIKSHFVRFCRYYNYDYFQYISCFFDEMVDKEFTFTKGSRQSDTFKLYFAVYVELLETQYAGTSYEFNMSRYDGIGPISNILTLASRSNPYIPTAGNLGLYVLLKKTSSDQVARDRIIYGNNESRGDGVDHKTVSTIMIYPKSNGDSGENATIKKYPYDKLDTVVSNMSGYDSTTIKLYDSESQNYYREVEIKSIEKTELDKTESLESRVSFECLEPWINHVTSLVEHDEDDANYLIVDSDSHALSPCTLFIEGPVSNPEWKQYVDGNEIVTGKYIGDILDGETLVIHSKPGENKIYLLSNNTSTDVYQNSDFSTARFMYIRHGNNKFVVNNYQYVETEDESFEEGKTYYELTSTNPDVYTVTSDVSMVSGKTYYEYVNVELDCRIEGELYYESV